MEDRLLGGEDLSEALSEALSDFSDRYCTIYITLLSNNRLQENSKYILVTTNCDINCMIIICTWTKPNKEEYKKTVFV